jgi:hypothetical protein
MNLLALTLLRLGKISAPHQSAEGEQAQPYFSSALHGITTFVLREAGCCAFWGIAGDGEHRGTAGSG